MRVAPLSNSYMVLAVTPRASPNCSLLIPRAILRNRTQTAYLDVDWVGHSERQKGFRREVNSDFWKLPLRRLTVRISDFVSPSKGTFVLYYGMAASQDLGEALRNLARYLKVANESVRVVVCEKADDTVLLVVREVAKQDERHVVEFALTVLLRGCRKMTRCRLRPKAVTFAHGRNADVAEFERFFECPVLFRADADTIVVPTVLLLTPIPSSNNYLLRILKEHCESIMAERGKPSGPLRAMVDDEISALLPHDEPQIDSRRQFRYGCSNAREASFRGRHQLRRGPIIKSDCLAVGLFGGHIPQSRV
jgi:Arabinose-binding domain of AraC transcription regulator, N-term